MFTYLSFGTCHFGVTDNFWSQKNAGRSGRKMLFLKMLYPEI